MQVYQRNFNLMGSTFKVLSIELIIYVTNGFNSTCCCNFSEFLHINSGSTLKVLDLDEPGNIMLHPPWLF